MVLLFAMTATCLLLPRPGFALDDQPESAVGSVMRLWRSGRVAVDRLPSLIDIVGSRGNEHDLRFLYDQVLTAADWPAELRLRGLRQLLDAAETRKTMPTGDLSGIASLAESDDEATRLVAVALCGVWRIESSAAMLQGLAVAADTSIALRRAAVRSLVELGEEPAGDTLRSMCDAARPFEVRVLGAAGLVSLDVEEAANRAAELLESATASDDPTPLLDAFLQKQGASDVLAAAIETRVIPEDVAKVALRHMYSVGRSDGSLSTTFGRFAGFDTDPQPPTAEEVAVIAQEVTTSGDPVRGEQVFRRADLSCFKCHAVSKAGGQVGPDLSAIGSSSPADYIIHSVLNPDRDVKEAFISLTVATVEGDILQGILVDRTEERLTLRDANGQQIVIPADDIDDEIQGKSLMPKGLVKFMTRQELIDLLAFLTSLGKPGENAIRETQRMQRWRVLRGADAEVLEEVPTPATYSALVLGSQNWAPAYSWVNGRLPLDEISAVDQSPVQYVMGEIEVSEPGDVQFVLNSADGLTAWIEQEEVGSQAQFLRRLEAGRHRIVLRIDLRERSDAGVTLEVRRPSGSSAEVVVVDGA
jgi:putative heme-binding domain-containing protein